MVFPWFSHGFPIKTSMAGKSPPFRWTQAQLAAKAAEKQAQQREKPLTCLGKCPVLVYTDKDG